MRPRAGPRPSFSGNTGSRAHLYSALALRWCCQRLAPRLLKMDEAKAQPNNQSIPAGRCSAALLCHPCPCTVSVLTQAFHFYASLFITRQTIPARVVQGKNNTPSLVWLSPSLILSYYTHPALFVFVCFVSDSSVTRPFKSQF